METLPGRVHKDERGLWIPITSDCGLEGPRRKRLICLQSLPSTAPLRTPKKRIDDGDRFGRKLTNSTGNCGYYLRLIKKNPGPLRLCANVNARLQSPQRSLTAAPSRTGQPEIGLTALSDVNRRRRQFTVARSFLTCVWAGATLCESDRPAGHEKKVGDPAFGVQGLLTTS